MPRGDKTGPYSAGPMTGRAVGYCAGYSVPGYRNPVRGYGRGFGRGWGRGLGRGRIRGFGKGGYVYPPSTIIQPTFPYAHPPIPQPTTPEHEVAALENYHKELIAEKANLEKEMDYIKARIEEFKAKIENKQPQPEP